MTAPEVGGDKSSAYGEAVVGGVGSGLAPCSRLDVEALAALRVYRLLGGIDA